MKPEDLKTGVIRFSLFKVLRDKAEKESLGSVGDMWREMYVRFDILRSHGATMKDWDEGDEYLLKHV
ncbi:hypothetical protein [Pseudomonas phage LUZ7]|uniref:Uncharacterized protein n=1 Tax=Pseudomonas phage LUZ7 TaxID=655097 RepID=C8ZKL3_9CAUD|nr:hypothetical protein PP-LUZ7_gp114 [Pseudomonas phage LUZ7]CAZ66255.1 hypothetical protein [Pseudomonas phage LUZ7]